MDISVLFLVCSLASSSLSLPQRFPGGASTRGHSFGASPPQPQQWPIIPYSYGYEVQDPLTNNYQNKAEIKTANGDVFGSYSVLMPDGYIYTTTYNSTQLSGFVSRLVKTLAILPQQLAANTAAQQLQQKPVVAQPQQFHLVKSQPQLPQHTQQVPQPQPQQVHHQFQPQHQLSQTQNLQQQLVKAPLQQTHQIQPHQQLVQPQQLQQHNLQQQLPRPQQLQPQQLPTSFLQSQQPLLQSHVPFRTLA